jgi:hypothetical protein
MENSKAQQKIIDLGKTIVKELELDPGVDTLAKWMAHYVAEKIELVENLTGKEMKRAQKECFETILKLWEHRWSIPRGKPFLKDFESLFETLEKLNRNKGTPFFVPPEIQFDFKGKNDKEYTNEAKSHFDTALRVDRIARSLICDLLNKAVSGLELTGKRRELMRNAIDLIDYPDTRIIRFISNYDELQEIKEDDETKKRINDLQKRINDLEEFSSIRDSLLDGYKKELSEIEK